MRTNRQKRVVWLYFGDHLHHPFICLGADSLVDAGYSVTVIDLATDAGNTSYQHISMICRDSVNSNLFVRLKKKIKAGLSMLQHIVANKPSYIIVTRPQFAFIGWFAAVLMNSRLIYHPFELTGEQHSFQSNILRKFESFFLRKAIHALITQNDERARVYVDERKSRVEPIIVHNYKPYKKVKRTGKLRNLLGISSECRIVLYEGYLSQGRCLKKLVQAAAYLSDDTKLVFMGRTFPWWEQNIEPLLTSPQLSEKIMVVPWVPHEELLSYVADADVGVIIYDDEVRNNYYCEPGKLSDYVLAGVPIIAPNFPTIAPIVTRYGIGFIFNSPEPSELANVIKSVLLTPRTNWLSAFDKACKDLVWETQVSNFLKAIEGGLANC